MRIALAQLTATSDPQVNLAAIQERTVDAAAAGAELVVFPEASMAVFGSAARAAAESVDGPWAAAVAELARTQGITIVVGMFTTTASSRIQNTLLVAGEASASYQKLHLFDALGYAESDQIAPGDEPVWFDLGGHRLGLATCYDVRFPGLFTHLARRGAEVILVPAAWAPGRTSCASGARWSAPGRWTRPVSWWRWTNRSRRPVIGFRPGLGIRWSPTRAASCCWNWGRRTSWR